MKLTVTTAARTIRRAAVTAAAPARAYREFVTARARDDLAYTSARARRTYRATWEPRHSRRRTRSNP